MNKRLEYFIERDYYIERAERRNGLLSHEKTFRYKGYVDRIMLMDFTGENIVDFIESITKDAFDGNLTFDCWYVLRESISAIIDSLSD